MPLDDCKSSFDCDAGAYCTFDGLDIGACSYCSELGNKKCKDVGFIDADDEDECKLECEGNKNLFSSKSINVCNFIYFPNAYNFKTLPNL